MCRVFPLIHKMSCLKIYSNFLKTLAVFSTLTFFSVLAMPEPKNLGGPDLSELTYTTDLLESNLHRIRGELEVSLKKEEKLFNQLQLLRYNDRIGSIQKKTVSSLEVNTEKSDLTVHSYPSDDKLVETEARSAELKSQILELEDSAIRLEREINKVRQMNSTVAIEDSEIFEEGMMIVVADELGLVLGTHYCGDSSCGSGETLSVDIPKSGTYYLRLISASTKNVPDTQYRIRPFRFADKEQTDQATSLVHLGERVSSELTSKDQKNGYRFFVENRIPLKIEMSSEVASATGWKLSILDELNSRIETIKCSSTDCKNGTTLLFTPKTQGEYRILIESGSDYSAPTGAYSFEILSASDQTKEIEPNDLRPQKMKIGEALVGSVSSIEDQDNYSIEIQKPGRLSIDLSGGG